MNLQPIEKKVAREDGALDIVDCFATIQGEGPFAGVPSVFVRLAGCTLDCGLCDTDYTSNRRTVGVMDLLTEVRKQRPSGLIVITGGEPMRQATGRFVRAALNAGYQVQFETNGTLADHSLDGIVQDITIVCSPKSGSIAIPAWVTCYKYVISADKVDPTDGLPTDSLAFGVRPARPPVGFRGTVYVQPCDDKDVDANTRNMRAAVDSCMKFGYRLCVQIHKIAELP